MTYRISCDKKILEGTVRLPGSKSISNRVLIIEKLTGERLRKQNLSEANDTVELQNALQIKSNEVQAGEGGTTFRFLTALLSFLQGEWLLKAEGSMRKRTVTELVDALSQLGAEIEYEEKEGFPPLKIIGGKLSGRKLKINSNISSQFISSLLLIGPYLPKGLELTLQGETVSASYITMTIQLMDYFGVTVEQQNNKLIVPKGNYQIKPIHIESDWSAASYWYELASLSESAILILKGLTKESLQGDSVVEAMFQSMQVVSTFKSREVQLTKLTEQQLSLFETSSEDIQNRKFTFNLSSVPDLFPALVVLCAAKGWEAVFTGVAHLEYKESNRLKIFKKELKQMGVTLKTDSEGNCLLKGRIKQGNYSVNTHNDHRVAMAFAPLAVTLGTIDIHNPEVVNKSYPQFWNELKKIGFKISEVQ